MINENAQPKRIAGIDGYRGGWIATVAEHNQMAKAWVAWDEDLRQLISQNSIDVVIVDMPIGLASKPNQRFVEQEARKALPGKTSSLFPVPCRQVLSCVEYSEASQLNHQVMGKKLTKQTWGLVPKIREVDELVRCKDANVEIREGHPEVSFSLFCGQPIVASKRSVRGVFERCGVLQQLGLDLMKMAKGLPEKHPASPDDLLDSAILLWSSSRFVMGKSVCFPIEEQFDDEGILMQLFA